MADAARTPQYQPGDFVRRRSAPERAGCVREARWDEQLEEWHYRVQFGDGLRGVPGAELEAVPDTSDPWEEAARGAFAGAQAFRSLLTYERLRKPPSRITASFGSAKALFFPYQFKPLLKFLESPRQRLLIADDVGLGKTIEAGYILRELRARHSLDRVLIVVPSRLRSKWRQELERRFDEHFQVVSARDLVRLGRRMERNQEPETFRWIVSVESARGEPVLRMLGTYQPPIDLVVVDEAHRMRNQGTLQNRLGRALRDCADAILFLTATPVQTGLDNLFSLLNLLDAEQFASYPVFAEQVEANRPIVRALNALRTRPPRVEDAVASLEEIAGHPQTVDLVQGRFYRSLVERAERADALSRDEIVDLQRDLSELSLTSHIISRTRKVEVLPDRPQRKAQAALVEFTDEERTFYNAVAMLVAMVRPDLDGWGLMMSTITAYRYTASCIPAAVELFRERLANMDADLDLLTDALGETEDDSGWLESGNGGGAGDRSARDRIRVRFASIVDQLAPPSGVDSKFDMFRRALNALWRDDRAQRREPRKVVVFAFFKSTLRYLSRRLRELGIRHQHIDGDVPMDKRELRIEEFATNPDIRVLLSSEVGGEGIDLQFSSVVVNYDLPWNPMVVEQRIGRVDRIGQRSPMITVINLVAKDTIEDRILFRLYNRIGLFCDAMGELEPILGQQVERLAIEALRGELSPDEQMRQAEQTADALTRQGQEARRFADDADALMAADQAFLDEVEAMLGRRRVPNAAELCVFLRKFLEDRYPGSRAPDALVNSVAKLEAPPRVGTALRKAFPGEPEVARLASKLHGGGLRATFDQTAATGHATAELLHAHHPLLRFAFQEMRSRHSELHRSFAMRLPLAAARRVARDVQPGVYAFSVWLFDVGGVRPRVEIAPVFVDHERDRTFTGEMAESLLLAMLDVAGDLDLVEPIDEDAVRSTGRRIHAVAHELRVALEARESALNEARHERRRATLDATLRARVEAARQRLDGLESKSAPEFPVRMARRRLQRADQDRNATLEQLGDTPDLAVEDEEVAVGLLIVE